MKKTYKIMVRVLEVEGLIDNFNYQDVNQELNIYRTPEGFELESNSNSFGDAYKETLDRRKHGKADLFKELKESPMHTDNLYLFVQRYQPFLIDLKTLSEDDSIEVVKLQVEGKDLTLVYRKPKTLGMPLGRSRMTVEALLGISEGCYTSRPSKRLYGAPMSSQRYAPASGTEVRSYASKNLFLIDGWITDDYIKLPGRDIEPSLTLACKTPLRSKDQITPDAKYILYKAEGSSVKPWAMLGLSGDEPLDEVRNLMGSHQEFMRPYSFVRDKITLVIDGQETQDLHCKGFQEEVERLSAEGIPTFNFDY